MRWLAAKCVHKCGRLPVRHAKPDDQTQRGRYQSSRQGLVGNAQGVEYIDFKANRAAFLHGKECPSWVTSRSPAWASECPLLGVKQKSISGRCMSAFSQERTLNAGGRAIFPWLLLSAGRQSSKAAAFRPEPIGRIQAAGWRRRKCCTLGGKLGIGFCRLKSCAVSVAVNSSRE